MRVVAFDISSSTGVAYGVAGGTPRFTTIRLDRGQSEAARFAQMMRATDEILSKLRPDLVVYESPIGGPRAQAFLIGLTACFNGTAMRLGHRAESLQLSTIRRHFLGKNLTARDFPDMTKAQSRAAIKKAVVARCYALGWKVRNDDEGDAVAAWDFTCATRCRAQSAPAGGLFIGDTE